MTIREPHAAAAHNAVAERWYTAPSWRRRRAAVITKTQREGAIGRSCLSTKKVGRNIGRRKMEGYNGRTYQKRKAIPQ
jgi:hypothetical protein